MVRAIAARMIVSRRLGFFAIIGSVIVITMIVTALIGIGIAMIVIAMIVSCRRGFFSIIGSVIVITMIGIGIAVVVGVVFSDRDQWEDVR